MKKLKISIDPVGRPTVEAVGFIGGQCKTAAQPILDALRDTSKAEDVSVIEKPELHMHNGAEQEEHLYS